MYRIVDLMVCNISATNLYKVIRKKFAKVALLNNVNCYLYFLVRQSHLPKIVTFYPKIKTLTFVSINIFINRIILKQFSSMFMKIFFYHKLTFFFN